MGEASKRQCEVSSKGRCIWLIVAAMVLVFGLTYGLIVSHSSIETDGALQKGAFVNQKIDETSPRTDSLFKQADPAVYQLARKIEREEPISAEEVAALPEGALNERYGDDITLLFHALSSYNLQAIDVLLGAGSDPYMTDRVERSARDFTYYIGEMNMYSRPDLGQDFKTELIRLYLKHGGDPNHRLPSKAGTPFFYYVALMENYDGVEILLEAGANPLIGNRQDSAVPARTIARRHDRRSRELTRYIVCRGYFDFADMESVAGMIRALAPTGPTNLIRESIYRKLAMRILKYHPDFDEQEEKFAINKIFGGSIPWKEILDTSDEELCNG